MVTNDIKKRELNTPFFILPKPYFFNVSTCAFINVSMRAVSNLTTVLSIVTGLVTVPDPHDARVIVITTARAKSILFIEYKIR